MITTELALSNPGCYKDDKRAMEALFENLFRFSQFPLGSLPNFSLAGCLQYVPYIFNL